MWSKEQAQVVMRDLMQYVDVCIANDEDFEATLGIQAFDGGLSTGIDRIDTYKEYDKCIKKHSYSRRWRMDGNWYILSKSNSYCT